MKRFGLILAAFSLLFPIRPLWAVTYAYIPGQTNSSVVRVNTSDQTFESVAFTDPACGPYGAAVMPDGAFVLLTCQAQATLAKVSTADFTDGTVSETPISVGRNPRGVAIEPDAAYAYVANYDDNTVSRITLSTFTVSGNAVGVGEGPFGIAACKVKGTDKLKVYVANYLDSTVSVLIDDGTQLTPQAPLTVGMNPVGLAATPDGSYVYVANSGSNSMSVVRTSDDAVIQSITLGASPWGVAVSSQGAYVYITNSDILNGNSVTVIRTSDFMLLGTLPAGMRPLGVAAPVNGDFAYVINQGEDISAYAAISEVDVTTGTPVVDNVTMDHTHPIQGAFALGSFIGGTPPIAPSELTGTVTGNKIVDLAWKDNSSDELGFKIERRKKGETAYIQIAKAATDATSYQDFDLEPLTTYEYRVRAYNEVADSAYASTSGDLITGENDFHWCFIGTLLR